jgi:hypothetical protein
VKKGDAMVKIIPLIKRGLLGSFALILVASTPLAAIASADPATCTPPPATQPGVHKPVGADAATYTYNCNTGMWENAHFTYNPANGQVTAKDPVVYTYNSATGMYDSTTWVYDAPHNTYDPITTSVTQPPAGANVVGGPVAPASSTISDTGPGSNNTINDNGGTGGSISNTGPDSNNTISGSNSNDTTLDNTNNSSINNVLVGQASTGNALVIGNTTGGSATSGDAQDIANAVNMLQSSSNALGGKTVTFVANINGDVNGDFMLDPSTLGSASTVQPASVNPAIGNNNLTINNQNNATINNNINLAANSGDATVSNNTTGGNATSGSAEAIANVVNLIDSAISGGNSFVGVININGNLNGDILIPPDLVNQLVASNVPTVSIDTTGPNSNNTITSNDNSNKTNITNTNNEGITNNVNATAASGQATVSNNTTAGNATSGNASTNVTAFNLTGSTVIGTNDLLVFVNVLGSWVGMIVNAPAGATAAELGGGITTDTQNGSNNNTTVNNNNNEKINNNITTSAQSGNADVSSNTSGGNATSGNAKNAVNLLNVEDSNLSLSGFFGLLFINVFGNWNGSFGINTSAGDPVATGMTGSGGSSSTAATLPAAMKVFSFIPHGSSGTNTGNTGNSGSSTVSASISGTPPSSLNAALAARLAKSGAPAPQLQSAPRNLWLPIASISLFGLYVIGDIAYSMRNKRKAHQTV